MQNVALITGASSGIGHELAVLHAERGGDLVVVARNEDALRSLAAELASRHGTRVRVVPRDLTDEAAPTEIHDELARAGVKIDYLVNNAGFGGRGKFHERDWARDRAMIQLNVVALTALCRLFLPEFVERDRGRVLNVSSTASLVPGPLQAVYYATKAYVTSFSNALAEELRETGVTVTALLPGVTDTDFGRRSGMDETKMFDEAAPARDVARDGYEAMLAGRLQVISGVPLGQRLTLAAVPLAPKRLVLREVRKRQEVDE